MSTFLHCPWWHHVDFFGGGVIYNQRYEIDYLSSKLGKSVQMFFELCAK